MISSDFVIVGAVLALVGSSTYIVDTIKGKIQPNRVSFLCWALAPLIAFFAEIKQGVGIQSLTTFIVGFMPLIILISSFVNKKAEWKLTAFDLTCGGLSILGLILWLITRTGNIAILFSIFADGMAAVPTVIKSFKYPKTENGFAYGMGAVDALLTILTIKFWSFGNWGYPLYILLIDSIIFTFVQFKVGKNFVKK